MKVLFVVLLFVGLVANHVDEALASTNDCGLIGPTEWINGGLSNLISSIASAPLAPLAEKLSYLPLFSGCTPLTASNSGQTVRFSYVSNQVSKFSSTNNATGSFYFDSKKTRNSWPVYELSFGEIKNVNQENFNVETTHDSQSRVIKLVFKFNPQLKEKYVLPFFFYSSLQQLDNVIKSIPTNELTITNYFFYQDSDLPTQCTQWVMKIYNFETNYYLNYTKNSNGQITIVDITIDNNSGKHTGNAEFTYNSEGKISHLTYSLQNLAISFNYDGNGRIIELDLTKPISQKVSINYDTNGEIVSAILPSNDIWTFSY